MVFDWSFALFHSAHLGPARSLPQQSFQIGKLTRRSRGIDFHAAVVHVAHPSPQAQCLRRMLHEITEAYALHAAAHAIEFGQLSISQGFLSRGYTTMRRNSTDPRLPCRRMGPGSASLVSNAMLVGPSMLCRLSTRMPFKTTVTSRPTNRIPSICHSPADFSALSVGARRPRIAPVSRLEGGRSASSAIWTS